MTKAPWAFGVERGGEGSEVVFRFFTPATISLFLTMERADKKLNNYWTFTYYCGINHDYGR